MAVTFPSGVYPALASVDVLNLGMINTPIDSGLSRNGSLLCGIDTNFHSTYSWLVRQLTALLLDAYLPKGSVAPGKTLPPL